MLPIVAAEGSNSARGKTSQVQRGKKTQEKLFITLLMLADHFVVSL